MTSRQPATPSSNATRRNATVAAGFVTGMLSGLLSRPDGMPKIRALLDAANVSSGVLTDPGQRINVIQYAELYNCIVRELDDEAFGLFTRPLRCGSFELLCRSVLSAPTLEESLHRTIRYLRILLPDFSMTLERPPGAPAQLHIELLADTPLTYLATTHPARVFAFEWLLRLIHGLSCWLVARGLALDDVSFPYPRPPHADDYALIYTANSRFSGDAAAAPPANNTVNCLIARFSANLLDLPVRRDDAALHRFLDGAPGKIAHLYRRDRETVLRVRDLLRAALPDLPNAADCADVLHLSERTLHRRLADEGTHFRAIRDALRRDLALSRLTKSSTPIARLAADLGYAEPSAFFRAVKNWTGHSPSAYRKMTEMHQK